MITRCHIHDLYPVVNTKAGETGSPPIKGILQHAVATHGPQKSLDYKFRISTEKDTWQVTEIREMGINGTFLYP